MDSNTLAEGARKALRSLAAAVSPGDTRDDKARTARDSIRSGGAGTLTHREGTRLSRLGLAFTLSFVLFGCSVFGSGVTPEVGGFGGRLQPGATFSVLFFVLDGKANAVDFAGVVCAPNGKITSGAIKVAEGIDIADGSWRAESTDVVIEGKFVTPTRTEGTARALTAQAASCGIGKSAAWVAECDLSVKKGREAGPSGGLVFGNESVTKDGGTAFSLVSVVTSNGDRLIGESLNTGRC